MNAKDELLQFLARIGKTLEDVIAFSIYMGDDNYKPYFYLKGNKLEEFMLHGLNKDYDNSYGQQYLYGQILFSDNSWMERGEYDGSEWWEYLSPPSVEEVLGQFEHLYDLRTG